MGGDMPEKTPERKPLALLKMALAILFSNPPIVLPFLCIAFVQLFIFEILLFAGRNPLRVFMGPIIQRMEGDIFLHYPFNYLLLIKWWQNSFLQSAIYIFIGSFFLGCAVAAIEAVNSNRSSNFTALLKKTLNSYVHLFAAAVITVSSMFFFSFLHGLVIGRALAIRSESGLLLWIKQAVLLSAPFVNLFIAALVTVLFIYVIPGIVLDGRKIWGALANNFRMLAKSAGITFGVVLLSALLYIPAVVLKLFSPAYQKAVAPELWPIVPLLGVFLSLFIDALQYTAITTYYLLMKETK